MALYRFKGDGWPPGWSDTEKRISWAVGLTVINFAFHASEYYHEILYARAFPFLAFAAACEILYVCAFPFLAFAAACLPHAQFQSMGRTAGTTFIGCFCGMAAVGWASAAIIYLPSLYFLSSPYVAVKTGIMALGMPLAYTLGYAMPFSIPQAHLRTNTTEWGEFFTGAVYFAAILA